MGLFTWIIIAVLILSIIGLGWQTFVGGVFKGGEKIINSNPEIKNVTQKVKQYIKNASEELIENNTISNQSSSGTIQSEEEEGNKEKLHIIELVIYYPSIYKS
jgi:preprotein translocase subunit SecF